MKLKISIARYLAEKFGLAGKNDIEKAQCNMLVDQIFFDMNITQIGGVLGIKNVDEKKLAWSSLMKEKIPYMLKLIENVLEANPSQSGYLVNYDIYMMKKLLFFELKHYLTHNGKKTFIKKHNYLFIPRTTNNIKIANCKSYLTVKIVFIKCSLYKSNL